MKRLILTISLFFAVSISGFVVAQNINININLDKQPSWGPSGYDYAGYYYFPDINIYFDVSNSLFYYLSGSKWVSNQYLPDKYRKYDLYSMYKAVINDQQPWLNNKNHKKTYSQYKGDKTQEAIRYSSNSKYSTSKDNNRQWVNTNQPNRTNSNSNQKNNSNNNRNNDNRNSGKQSNNNSNRR